MTQTALPDVLQTLEARRALLAGMVAALAAPDDHGDEATDRHQATRARERQRLLRVRPGGGLLLRCNVQRAQIEHDFRNGRDQRAGDLMRIHIDKPTGRLTR